MTATSPPPPDAGLRERVRVVIFEAETPVGKAFDVVLLWTIVLSVLAVMLESVRSIAQHHGPALRMIEWVFTGLFTLEYVTRLWCVPRPLVYARSFYGIVDLLAVLPTYVSLLHPGSQTLVVVRALRLLRIFRVFKLGRYLSEANVLTTALRSSARKVVVFLGTVLIMVLIMGSVMYLVEGVESGFTSIPRSMYWAIVTMTTVGYGDIAPRTVPGQVIAAAIMIIGYSVIAVPTGIVTAEMTQLRIRPLTTRTCRSCLSEGHLLEARFCRDCGEALEKPDGDG